jgi:hypothetical protein
MNSPSIGISSAELVQEFLLFGLDQDLFATCPLVVSSERMNEFQAWLTKDHGERQLVVAVDIASAPVLDGALQRRRIALLVVGDPDELLIQELPPIDREIDEAGAAWIQKPVDLALLARRVAEVSNRAAQTPDLIDPEDAVAAAEERALEAEADETPEEIEGDVSRLDAAMAPPLAAEDLLHPDKRDLPLHLRRRGGQASPPPTSVPPPSGTYRVRASAPPIPTPPAPAPEGVPAVLVGEVTGSNDPLCAALRPFISGGQEFFRMAARYALGNLPVETWVAGPRGQAASFGVQERELAALGLYRLSASAPNRRDPGVTAVLKAVA